MTVITIVLLLIAVYALIGVCFAAWFVAAGVKRIDEAAAAPTLGFRVLIFPGSAALWPIMLRRWLCMKGKVDA